MAKYIVHKAVGPDKVKKKLQRTLDWYGENYLAQLKYDGCNAVMRLDPTGATSTMSRTGETVLALGVEEEGLWEEYQEAIHEHGGLVLLGEAYAIGKDFSVISGEFRRHKISEWLDFYVFDVLTIAEFDAGHSAVPYVERVARLGPYSNLVASEAPGSYGCPQALCNKVLLAKGFDGLILRDPMGTWTMGNGTTGEIIKIKRVLSFDLQVTGVEPGKGKHEGRMGALVVKFGNKELRVGTGFSDREREDWWAYHALPNPDPANDIIGKIVEIEAMDYSSEGLLREPRFKGIRYDKLEPDTIAA